MIRLKDIFIPDSGNNLTTERKASLKNFMSSRVMMFNVYILCIQTFLPGFAVSIGANDFTVSLITMIPSAFLLTQVLSPLIFEGRTHRKKLVSAIQAGYGLSVFMIILLPFFFPKGYIEYALIVNVAVSMLMYAQYKTGIDMWMVELLTPDTLGRYIAKLRYLSNLALLVLIPLFGVVLDIAKGSYYGFFIIFMFSGLLSLFAAIKLRGIEDVRYKVAEPENAGFFKMLKGLAQDSEYLRLSRNAFAIYFIIWICYSFRSLYMLRYLGVSYSFYSTAANLSILSEIVFAVIWVKVAAKKGWKMVFVSSVLLYSVEFFSWTMMTQQLAGLAIISFLLAGTSNSALILSTMNLRYSCMKPESRSAYEGVFCMLCGVASMLGPAAGNLLRKPLAVISGGTGGGNDLRPVFAIAFVTCFVFFIYVCFQNKFFFKTGGIVNDRKG